MGKPVFLTHSLVEAVVLDFRHKLLAAANRNNATPGCYVGIFDCSHQYDGMVGDERCVYEAAFGLIRLDSNKGRLLRGNAMKMVKLSWRTGMSLDQLREMPFLYREGDFRFIGAENEHGLIVVVEGLHEADCQKFAREIMGEILQACSKAFKRSSFPDSQYEF